jgi:hypothetical protein
MNPCVLKFVCSIVIYSGFLAFTSANLAIAADENALLPAGWTLLPIEKSTKAGDVVIEGYFSSRTVKTKAMLVENKAEDRYGLAATMRPNKKAIIIDTFKVAVANPPSLNVVKSGKYYPFCPPESKNCDAFFVKKQAIGLYFDEASGQIIYFDKNKFNVVHVAD